MRGKISLNGVWHYWVDQHDDLDFHTSLPYNYKNIYIPHDWSDASIKDDAVVWYRTTFTLSHDYKNKHITLKFEGIDFKCSVWLNEQKIGDHTGYFQPFEFYINPHILWDQKNYLTVRVESRKAFHDIVPREGDSFAQKKYEDYFVNSSGICNDVYLHIHHSLKIDSAKISPLLLDSGDAIVKVAVNVTNYELIQQEATLQITMQGYNFKSNEIIVNLKHIKVSSGNNSITINVRIKNAQLWWPWDQGKQNLYLVGVVIQRDSEILDTKYVKCGIRQIEKSSNNEWYINKRKIFIRGTSFLPVKTFASYQLEQIKKDIAHLKALKINTLRIFAHVNRSELYDACDDAGIMVWQDSPLIGDYAETDAFIEFAEQQIEDMVNHLHLHPSIIVWGCHSESIKNAGTLDHLFYKKVQEQDTTRHIFKTQIFETDSYYTLLQKDVYQKVTLPSADFPTFIGLQSLPNLKIVQRLKDVKDLWPPKWERWREIGLENSESQYDTGKIEGKSLQAFIDLTQEYQGSTLKYYIEKMRCLRFNPFNGFSQFFFKDNKPCISKSVIDMEGNPKLAYRSLQISCQPVLIHLNINAYSLPLHHHERLLQSVIIVNDLYKRFDDSILKICLEDHHSHEVIREFITISIESFNLQEIIPKNDQWNDELKLDGGDYLLQAELIDKTGRLVSTNQEKITI